MSGRTKPPRRRKYARKSDGITIARMHNTRLTPAEIARIIEPCKAALNAMRQGVATHAHFVVLCTAGHVAQAIDNGGIYTGQSCIIDEANNALDAIGNRAGFNTTQWKAPTCHGHEITALADLVAAHSRQVHELTYGEYTRAADKAVARVATDGGQVFKMETSHT